MKAVYALMILAICMTGCSFRDGAAFTASSLTSAAASMVGYEMQYEEAAGFWDEKLGANKGLPPRDHVVMTGVDDNPTDQSQHFQQYQSSHR